MPGPTHALWAGLVMLLGCHGTGPGPGGLPEGPAPGELEPEERVLVAVFQHELHAAVVPAGDPVCLRVRGAGGRLGDAGARVVASLRSGHPGTVAASACQGGGPEPVKLRAGGRRAWIMDIGPVKWDGAPAARAARVEGGGASRGGTWVIREVEYRLELQGGAWRVVGERVMRQT